MESVPLFHVISFRTQFSGIHAVMSKENSFDGIFNFFESLIPKPIDEKEAKDNSIEEILDHLRQLVSTYMHQKVAEPNPSKEWYKNYKESFVKILQFEPEGANLSIHSQIHHMLLLTLFDPQICPHPAQTCIPVKNLTNEIISVTEIAQAPLEEVFIFFDTATFDKIEKDVKVNTELKGDLYYINII